LPKQRWFDGSGRPLPEQFHSQRLFLDPGTDASQLVQLNHYALGAAESYVLKCARGRAVHGDDRLGMDYWVDRNFCDVEDRSILNVPSLALRDELHADATLHRLHAAAVIWRKDRFRALMQEEPWRALFGRLLMTPPSRVLDRSALRRMFGP
jgi:hypothetical protein